MVLIQDFLLINHLNNMKSFFQYIYYRLSMFYKKRFGIEESSSFFIQSCYGWGLLILLVSVCFYLLAAETYVLWFFGKQMKVAFILVTILPFAIIHIFFEQFFGNEKERFKKLESKFKNERLSIVKGLAIFVFVTLSFVSYFVALFLCK